MSGSLSTQPRHLLEDRARLKFADCSSFLIFNAAGNVLASSFKVRDFLTV
jgi:hypothetical protein